MTTNNKLQSQAGPIAQQLAKMQTNEQQTPSNGQQPLAGQPQKRIPNWTGFSGKTLWDWLGVVLVPIMIAVFTIAIGILQIEINQRQHDYDQIIAADNRQADLQRQQDQQRETMLNSYIHDINDLIFNRGLRESRPTSEVRVIARAETISTLRQLDSKRKEIVMQFLSEAGLITSAGKDVIIDLSDADLSDVSLFAAHLQGAHLADANLRHANLMFANLEGADLEGTNLEGARLGDANLRHTDLEPRLQIGRHGLIIHPTNLRDAYLVDADLEGAKLINVDFQNTNLELADLKGAQVTEEQLAEASSLKDATMPDGSIHP